MKPSLSSRFTTISTKSQRYCTLTLNGGHLTLTTMDGMVNKTLETTSSDQKLENSLQRFTVSSIMPQFLGTKWISTSKN